MRLDRYIAETGLASRSEVKNLIRVGRVTVKGILKPAPDYQVRDEDEVCLDGKKVVLQEFEYWLLYKPQGYLTAREDRHKPVVMELIPSRRKDLSPVGRLDEDTEGLLLVTNDGAMNHRLLSPKNHVEKTYFAELDSSLPDNAKDILEAPIVFEDFTSLPGKYEKITDTSAFLTISEGKYHQVKRMFQHIGCRVTYLKRVSFGPLELGVMQPGDCRPLTEEEISKLR